MLIQFENLEDLLIYNIKYYRYLKDYSQVELCRRCNFKLRYITDVERGKHMPTISKIELIAKALEIEPYELFVNIKREKSIVERIENSRQYNQKNIL